ncbi:sensor domain-containing diguanylate cyclase [Vogesella indigofera]|uniref:sensor domain-containing diguanylate cyclase n=1 Tax=Vogesella indigofera TaxID=45465 RepID=UPI003F4296F3
MPDPQRIRDALLLHSASCIGKKYLQQLVSQLACLTGAERVLLSQRSGGPHRQLQVLFANDATAGTARQLPCNCLFDTRQPLLLGRGLRQCLPDAGQQAWQSCLAWPLLDGDAHCLGHLALLDARPDFFAPELPALLQPFIERAGAELEQLQQREKLARRQHWQLLHSDILRQNAQGTPLDALLHTVVQQIELALPEWRCSILLLDSRGRLQPVAGPSLPSAYQQRLVGLAPGPMVGSCGAAVWHAKRVVAENLQLHPNWAPYRELAARFELGSCWSEPLIDSKGTVHGTFAVYHRTPSAPTPQAITILEDTARLLALLLENQTIHRQLDSRSQWYRAILQNAADGLSIIDMNGRFLEASDSLCQMLGYSLDELLHMHLWQVVPGSTPQSIRQRLAATGEDGETFESVNRTKHGALLDVEVSARRLMLDGQPVIWGSARDISQRKALQRILEQQATIDALTGLFNRPTLLARLETQLQLAQVQHAPLSVLMLDLDHFKQINDRYGHHAGDLVLAALGDALEEVLRESDVAGRIGGEEFCLLLPGLGLHEALDLAERIIDDISELRIQSGHHILAITSSIGVACLQADDDSRTLLARADSALYAAKAAGRHRAVALSADPP